MTSGINERPYLSIGEVLGLLLEEFPDVTISKIRFLESQGLIEPERTASGYRKFFDADVERLKMILREQRENFLPLRVIRDRLEAGAIDDTGSTAAPAAATPPRGLRNVRVPQGPGSAAGLPTTAAPEGSVPAAVGGPAGAADTEPSLDTGDTAAGGATVVDPVHTGRHPAAQLRPASGPMLAASSALPPPDEAPGARTAPRASGRARAASAPRVEDGPEADRGGDAAAAHAIASRRDPSQGVASPAAPAAPAAPAVPAAGGPAVAARQGADEAPPPAPTASTADPPRTTSGPVTPPSAGPGEAASSTPAASPAADVQPARAEVPIAVPGRSGVPYLRAEACAVAGISVEQLGELEAYGVVSGRGTGANATYGDGEIAILRAAAGFLARGIDARHLRAWRQSAEREAGLFEQRILPLLRQRNPQARHDAIQLLQELAALGADLRAAIVTSALRQHLEP